MFPVCACIGQCIHIHCLQNPLIIAAYFYPNLHLMAGRGCYLGFIAAVYDLCRLSRFHGNNGRIYLCHYGLLCAKASADSWLDHTYL